MACDSRKIVIAAEDRAIIPVTDELSEQERD
jgi:hypothetical protein